MLTTVLACFGCAGAAPPLGETPRATALSAAERQTLCKEIRCRPPTVVELPLEHAIDGSTSFSAEFPVSPWVIGPGRIHLLPGEAITVAAQIGEQGALHGLEVLELSGDEPAPVTVSLHFAPPALAFNALRVENRFPSTLHLTIAVFGPQQAQATEVMKLSVPPGVSSVEIWSAPTTEIEIGELRVTGRD